MLSLLLLLSSPDALANSKKGAQLHMWGGGVTVSTMAWPGAYPNSFPAATDELNPNPRDNLSRVRGDLGVAGRGLLYLRNMQRVGARVNVGMGDGYRATTLTFEYEQSIIRQENINVFIGAGVGVGTLTFDQGEPDDDGLGGTLSTNTYNTRLQIAATYRDMKGKKNKGDDRAYEVAFYATPIGSNGPETYEYGDVTIEDPERSSAMAFLTSDEDDNQALRGSLYNPTIGIEVSVFFGDFTPPTAGKKKKKKNKK